MSKKNQETDVAERGTLRVLVTGASGFVGGAIAEQCRREGMNVLSTGRRSDDKTTLPGYFTADVTDPESLKDALANVDCVVHAAGIAHQFRNGKKPAPFQKVNVRGTENVVAASVRAGVRHVVLVSSVSVYGPHGIEACDETATCNPSEPYGQSKYQAEQRALEIVEKSNSQLTILRPATVFGEGDPGNVARLMRTIDRARFVWVGDGSNRKSLIHKDDLARACASVVRQASPGRNTYNVSASVATMREIVESLASSLKRELPGWRIPVGVAKAMALSIDRISRGGRKGGRFGRTVDRWLEDDVYDAGKFNREFNFAATVSLSEGLLREVDWYRKGRVQ